ncbi:MAG: hypothetical protein NXI31_25135 [bacterium]|nr:hypothetical protein [bacterium]
MRTTRAKKGRATNEAGFTFAEVTFAMLILVVGAAVLINHIAVNYQTTRVEKDRVFAYAKAQGILSEIQNLVDRGATDSAVDLDALDDGVTSNNTLTITTDATSTLVAPDHVLSGNYQRHGTWLWTRRISVQPFSGVNNRNVRYVTVTIFRRDEDGNEIAMADLSSVINSAAVAFPTTQVFDVYLLAIENIPGWWVYMDTIKPFVESMITDLESRNPGLVFRTHWITKSSFGRNQGYRPYVNDSNDSRQPVPDVYHYPGKMPAGSSSVYYYVPDNIKGHINLDGVATNGYDATLNPHPYALADYFNHSMRYPQEKALWDTRIAEIEAREAAIAAAKAGGTTPPAELDDMSKEPTLRLFLEDMITAPEKYKNALVINLHGELLPMPPLRNYSDAARVPLKAPHVRVVTHPEELRTMRDDVSPGSSDPVVLRMYAYLDDPNYSGIDRINSSDPIAPNYTIVDVMGVDLVDETTFKMMSFARLQCVPGGVPANGTSDYATSWQDATFLSDATDPTQMWYYAFPVQNGTDPVFTRIVLANTPVVCPPVSGYGLDAGFNLYGMHYVPSPVEVGRDFTNDLTTPTSGDLPKNTARWRLTIDPVALTNNSFTTPTNGRYNPDDDVVLEVRTRIYTGPTEGGVAWPPANRYEPENLSVTYTWWADSADDVPATERAQFNGDPRHLPYKDCFNGATDFPNSYNWYHDDLWDGTDYAGWDYPALDAYRIRDRWNGAMSCDVPRLMQLFRQGLTNSACVYTTLTGYSYYYTGIGNDIGYDSANGYPSSIPSNMIPHGGTGSGYLNTITSSRRWVREPGSNAWFGMPWLGELYPDTAASVWQAEDVAGNMRGNLNPGTGTGEFYQTPVNSAYLASRRRAKGVEIRTHHQRAAGRGCVSFFNCGSGGATFDHIFAGGNGSMVGPGLEIANNYNLTLPTSAPISRPFSVTDNAWGADEWGYAPYSTNRYNATLFKTYFNHGSGTGSGAVKLVNPAGTDATYIVVNGIDRTVSTGTSFIAKWSVLTLVHSFFEAGDTSNTLRIQQLPRVEIDYPNDISELLNPPEIDIQYDVDWTRWDGLPYTQTGTFNENESLLEYAIMYSRDNGDTWLYVQDDTVATPHERPTSSTHLVPDLSIGQETFRWSTPSATFPRGTYLLQINCYRQGAQVHYCFHKTKIYVQR